MALFLHKPLFLNAPDDPELVATSIRYVPMPARSRLIEMLRAVDLRLVASGHVHQRRDFTFAHTRHIWAPSAGFIISDARQEVIGIKEVGLVEYRFQPDSFEVRHVRAPGQIDVDLDCCWQVSTRPTDRWRRSGGLTDGEAPRVRSRLRDHIVEASLTPCPVRRAPVACRNWRPSEAP